MSFFSRILNWKRPSLHETFAFTTWTSSAKENGDVSDAIITVLPHVGYSLHTNRRILRITIFLISLFLETCAQPIVLFYTLRKLSHLSTTTTLGIITALTGSVSMWRFVSRSWAMYWAKNSHEKRPISAGRWGLDLFQIWLPISLLAFFLPLIVGTSFTRASVAVVDLALPCFVLVFSIPLLVTGMYAERIRIPFRLSSMAPHTPLPPFTYMLVEDVVAVDGGGCRAFREAWRARYEASAEMRSLLCGLSLLWGSSGCLISGALIVVAATTSDDVGFGLCFTVPWLWASIGGLITIHWVRKALAHERRVWQEDNGVRVEEVTSVDVEAIGRGE